ncbi:MAG TPA: nucleotidyltransferase family protein [Nitrosopumilaceae archaeon]|nr:nucleotidyltransferase family protein [Nitrosopumilaceae archaeon]
MKAIILAGGKGTRAKPFTDFFPKALIPVEGKPLVDHIVSYLSSFRFIDEILIVSDFKGLGGQIKHYFENRKIKTKIKFIQDSGNGTAGDLLHASSSLKNSSEFILWFVDNLCAIDIKKMIEIFKQKKSLACIATRTIRKEETGFAIVEDNLITEFKEKPTIKMQMAECLGIYILGSDILKKIQRKKSQKDLNLSYDILQDLSKQGKVSAYDIEKKPWLDVESPTIIERNKKVVKQIIKEMR